MPPKSSSRAWDALTPKLSEWTLDAVAAMGFTRMTPVQASAIPLFMQHKDVVVEAVTGSGKTLSFLIPIVEKLLRLDQPLKKHHVGAIVIAPTRELAVQIHQVLLSLLEFHPASAAAIKPAEDGAPRAKTSSSTLKVVPQLLLGGGTSPAEDLKLFLKNSPNVLVSTPGRLLELLSSPHVHCPQASFEMLVLDEADRLLDLGFKDDLQKILGRLPKQRRTGLFSASISEAVDQIVRLGLRNPVKIAVKVRGAGVEEKRTPARYSANDLHGNTPASQICHSEAHPFNSPTHTSKNHFLRIDMLQCRLPRHNTTHNPRRRVRTGPTTWETPSQRPPKELQPLHHLHNPSILLTTDVAARGLDIPSVDLVVQIDPPSDPKTFIHRCGRAGRAGRRGLSIVLIHPGREEDYVSFLEIRKTPVAPYSLPEFTDEQAMASIDKVRKAVLKDRAMHDKGQKAFVSWLRSYSKHQASSIFRVADLDWEALGKAWGLLKLPKMPEARSFEGDRTLGIKLEWSNYTYKDKQQEKRRKEAMAEAANGQGAEQASNKRRATESVAWSQKAEERDKKFKKKEFNKARKEKERWEKLPEEEKQKALETERMLEEIRAKNEQQRLLNLAAKAEEEKNAEFKGFD
ncbi:DEAD/DEAH box helicase (Sbp4) [Penicillium cf. griseofulvum]|nr:DEAD/DEAH box helicase (Sbp4) [Penicillium cf. griseofulvum]